MRHFTPGQSRNWGVSDLAEILTCTCPGLFSQRNVVIQPLFFFFHFFLAVLPVLRVPHRRLTQASWWQLWSVHLMPSVSYGILKAPCMRIWHSASEPGGFMNPQTSAHSPGTPPGPHRGAGPGGKGKYVLAEASSIVLMGRCSLPDCRRHAAPLKSPATMSLPRSDIMVK